MENEHKPVMEIKIAGKEFEATPDNTSLYMHLGELAVYNHLFIQGELEGQPFAARVWKHQPGYEEGANFTMKNGYPLHVNLRKVDQTDIEAYDRMIERQMEDITEIPEDWA